MKWIKRFSLAAIVIVVIYGFQYAWRAFPVISGFSAKNLCSCAFLSQRSVDSVRKYELGSLPLSLGSVELNLSDSSAIGTVWGMARRKAIYRKGLGCTLIVGVDESSLREFQYNNISFAGFDPDTTDWPMGNLLPDSVAEGIDIAKLNEIVKHAFLEDVQEKLKNTRGVVVIYDGQIVAEQYGEGFDQNSPQLGWSMTKSVTHALVGILVKQGKIDIYKTAPVPEWQKDERANITLDQLLRMSSGLEWDENYGALSGATNMLFKESSMGNYAASYQLKSIPDEVWYYSSGTSNLISRIIREAVGEKYLYFPREVLFNKIGMLSAIIEPDASGTFVGSSYMFATPRDWARFALLYYNNGNWLGEEILPEGCVNYGREPTLLAPQGKYGSHFWLNAGSKENPENRIYPTLPADLYSMNGFEGQRVFIIPSKKAIIVRMGQTIIGNFDFEYFVQEILSTFPQDK